MLSLCAYAELPSSSWLRNIQLLPMVQMQESNMPAVVTHALPHELAARSVDC